MSQRVGLWPSSASLFAQTPFRNNYGAIWITRDLLLLLLLMDCSSVSIVQEDTVRVAKQEEEGQMSYYVREGAEGEGEEENPLKVNRNIVGD